MSDQPMILFICQHNAGRSQLGAHLFARVVGDVAPSRFRSTSAGLSPAAEINPVVAESLAESGIDTSAAHPREKGRAAVWGLQFSAFSPR